MGHRSYSIPNKLGYSLENLYTLDIPNEMCERNNYSLNVLLKENIYLLVEMRKNE